MKAFRIIYNSLAIIVVLCFAFSLTIYVSKTSFYAVATNSMAQEINQGDMVFVRPAEKYRKGDVITAKLPSGAVFTHRIYNVDDENGLVYTMGDNNPSPDGLPTAYADIIGKVIFTVPLLGQLSLKFSSVNVTFVLAGVLLVLIVIRFAVFSIKKPKEDERHEKIE